MSDGEQRRPSAPPIPKENLPLMVQHIPDDPRQILPVPTGYAPGSTEGLSQLSLTKVQQDILQREPDAQTEVEIRSDGVVYMPAGAIRDRLNEAFGPGDWALRQESTPRFDAETKECVYDGSLWINGRYAGRALGGCKWRPNNSGMTKSDAIEGAKSDCLRRCCKELGVGGPLWRPAWVRDWIAEYAVPYQGMVGYGDNAKPGTLWRKIGVALSGEQLANATSIVGEFPLGFGPQSPIPDGPHVGKPISEVSDEVVMQIATSAKIKEWKLTAKAEIVRRQRAAAEKTAAEKQEGDVSVEDVLPTNSEEAEND